MFLNCNSIIFKTYHKAGIYTIFEDLENRNTYTKKTSKRFKFLLNLDCKNLKKNF
jgi:hypothetical protein